MPISEMDGCSAAHWAEVHDLLKQAAEDAGFDASLVSESDQSGMIHARIVKNIYLAPMAVCDISARNPNVMFELGMRIAFDKPVVIVKDDKTPRVFDVEGVEYIQYPRDLRHFDILEFKDRLTAKIKSTLLGQGTGYLQSFGPIKVASMEVEKATPSQLKLDSLNEAVSEIHRMLARMPWATEPTRRPISEKRRVEAIGHLPEVERVIRPTDTLFERFCERNRDKVNFGDRSAVLAALEADLGDLSDMAKEKLVKSADAWFSRRFRRYGR